MIDTVNPQVARMFEKTGAILEKIKQLADAQHAIWQEPVGSYMPEQREDWLKRQQAAAKALDAFELELDEVL